MTANPGTYPCSWDSPLFALRITANAFIEERICNGKGPAIS
jgi:hypothetical protein